MDPALWAQAAGFLERRETFRADYQTFAGKVPAYELDPLHLLAYHGNWYLLALNAAKGRVESFALSRFRRIEGLGTTFDRPQDFDARAHARQAFGVTPGASRTVRCMKDCHANLFVGLTAPKRFFRRSSNTRRPFHPITIFMPRGAPFTGHGDLFGNDLREML